MRNLSKHVLGAAVIFAVTAALSPTAEANARAVGGLAGNPILPAWMNSNAPGSPCWTEMNGGIKYSPATDSPNYDGCAGPSATDQGWWEVPLPYDDGANSYSATFYLDAIAYGDAASCSLWEETPGGSITGTSWGSLSGSSTSIATSSISVSTNGAIYGVCALTLGYNGVTSTITPAPVLHTVVWSY